MKNNNIIAYESSMPCMFVGDWAFGEYYPEDTFFFRNTHRQTL